MEPNNGTAVDQVGGSKPTLGSRASLRSKISLGSKSEGQADGPKRETWGGQLEFILTLVGYAVGLGNVWRFPYLCFKNGGGAFLIPYFGTLIFIGLPLFYMECAFGQFASMGPIKIYSINPLFKGLGVAMVLTETTIGIYYNVIIAWILYFLFSSMTSVLPWQDCGHDWNTEYCVPTAQWKNLTDNVTLPSGIVVPKADLESPSEQFYYRQVLQVTGGIEETGGVIWQLALCLLLAWIIILAVLIKGISSLGKVVYFTTLFPYVLLTVMLIRGVTLEGALDGIIFYLKPDFSRLTDARVWSDAATQIFFSLSVATGGLTAMASYNDFRNNILRDGVMIPIINCATSFYGGFAIFSVLGYMAFQKGVTVEDVAASGPGLMFVVYPEALATMPVAPLWSIFFFLMMLTLGLSSMFSIVETGFTAFGDEFAHILKKNRLNNVIFRVVAVIVFYLIGLSMVTQGGFYVFNLFDNYLGGFPYLFTGLLETIAICYIYGWSRFGEDIQMMLGAKPNIYFSVCLCILVPVILLSLIIFMAVDYTPLTLLDVAYPDWAEVVGFLIVMFVLIWIPACWVYVIIKERFWENGLFNVIRENSQPTKNWKPALVENQTGRYAPGYDGPDTTGSWWKCCHDNAVASSGQEDDNKDVVETSVDDDVTYINGLDSKTPIGGVENKSFDNDNPVNV